MLTRDNQRLLQIIEYAHRVICSGCVFPTMDVKTHAIFLLLFLSHIHFANSREDCSIDGSCEGEQEKRGKEKYLPKGWV